MSPAHAHRTLRIVGLALLVVLTAGPAAAQSPRPGGILTLRLREDLPQGF